MAASKFQVKPAAEFSTSTGFLADLDEPERQIVADGASNRSLVLEAVSSLLSVMSRRMALGN